MSPQRTRTRRRSWRITTAGVRAPRAPSTTRTVPCCRPPTSTGSSAGKETRRVSTSLTLNYKRVLYVVDPTEAAQTASGQRIGIEEREGGSLAFWHGEHELLATVHRPRGTHGDLRGAEDTGHGSYRPVDIAPRCP